MIPPTEDEFPEEERERIKEMFDLDYVWELEYPDCRCSRDVDRWRDEREDHSDEPLHRVLGDFDAAPERDVEPADREYRLDDLGVCRFLWFEIRRSVAAKVAVWRERAREWLR